MDQPWDHRVNLRHLRVLLAVQDSGSVSAAAARCHLSQPAATLAIARVERMTGAQMFARLPQGLVPTPAAEALCRRIRRAFAHLDPALAAASPRLAMLGSQAQLRALIAVEAAESFTLAAAALGIAQPTVHRAIRQLEDETGRPLFARTPAGLAPSRSGRALAAAARLAFAELRQARAEMSPRDQDRIVIGAMPLARSHLLPQAIARFVKDRPGVGVHIVEGPYADLLTGLLRGDLDFLLGAIRDPAPTGGIVQQTLFHDTLAMVCGNTHPLAGKAQVSLADLAAHPWVVARQGTPARKHFDEVFGGAPPASIVESGSIILMRELLRLGDHLGCVSRLQADTEIACGLMQALPVDLAATSRPIGVTTREGWLPTAAQGRFLSFLHAADCCNARGDVYIEAETRGR